MRKLLVCLTVAAFAAVTSLQAADQCPMAKASCCDQAKTVSTWAKDCKAACTASTAAKASTSCCAASKAAKVAKARRNAETKGATLLVQR